MKYFVIGIIAITLMAVSGYISSSITKGQYRSKIADLHKLQNQETIKLQTKILKGEANHDQEIEQLVMHYKTMLDSIDNDIHYQIPETEEANWEEYIHFVPDKSPELEKIIKRVYLDKRITDHTRYSYSDKNNGYYIDFNISYDSKHQYFEIEPLNLVFERQKQNTTKKTTMSVQYFTPEAVCFTVQYDILPFFSIGGSAGWDDEPLVGIIIGYNF